MVTAAPPDAIVRAADGGTPALDVGADRRPSTLPSRLKRLAYHAACRAGVDDLARRRNRHRLLVVAYHGLRDGPPPVGTSWSLLPVGELERQLRHLAHHYRVVHIDRALAELRGGGLREPTACVTFDDGYRSNVDLGLPVLRRLGVPATVYLATAMVGTRRVVWTIGLDLAFQQTRRRSVDLGWLGLDEVEMTDVASRARAARAAIGRLKPLAPDERDAALLRLRDALDVGEVEDGGAYAMMGWDDAREMERSGLVTFGAHTENHEIVARLDDAGLEREVDGSLRTLDERLDHPSRTFAYPNGTAADFDARAGRLLRERGCVGAVSTMEGLSDAGTDPFALRRFNVGSGMRLDEFRLLTSGALRRMARV